MSMRVTFSRDYGNYVAGQTADVKDSTARVAIREGAAVLAEDPEPVEGQGPGPVKDPEPQGPRPTGAKSRRRKKKK